MIGNPEPLKPNARSRQVPVRIIRPLNVAGREEVGIFFFAVERPGARSSLQIANFCAPAGPAESGAGGRIDAIPLSSGRAMGRAPRPPSVPPFVQQRARTALIYYAVEFAGADHERFRRPTGMAVHTNRMRARSASGRPQRRGARSKQHLCQDRSSSGAKRLNDFYAPARARPGEAPNCAKARPGIILLTSGEQGLYVSVAGQIKESPDGGRRSGLSHSGPAG